MYHIISMLMTRKYILSSIIKISVSQNSIPFSVLYKCGCYERKPKLNKDKPNILVVGNPLQMRNINLPSNLKLDQTDKKSVNKTEKSRC